MHSATAKRGIVGSIAATPEHAACRRRQHNHKQQDDEFSMRPFHLNNHSVIRIVISPAEVMG